MAALGMVPLALVVVLAALAATGPGQAKVAGKPGIFGFLETERKGLKAFPKWTGALERYFKEKGKVSGACTAKSFNKCHYKSWKQFLDGVKGAPTGRKLKKINDFMNKARYIVDPINWGVKDYWETPGQFFNRYGDCEDYTIAKYLSLRVSTAEQKWATEAA